MDLVSMNSQSPVAGTISHYILQALHRCSLCAMVRDQKVLGPVPTALQKETGLPS